MGVVEAIFKLKYFGFFCFVLFFVNKKKTQGKWQEHRENTGNLVLIGAWQPCNSNIPGCRPEQFQPKLKSFVSNNNQDGNRNKTTECRRDFYSADNNAMARVFLEKR